MKTTPLHSRFGLEVHDVDLREVTATSGYPEIRDAFERHSLLLFRGQELDDVRHNNFASLFGPLEDRPADVSGTPPRETPPLPILSNLAKDGGGILDSGSLQVLNLKSTQLWHTDSTFLYTPALANIIAARVVPSSGGETELASTRAAWKDIPSHLRKRAENAVLMHSLSHSRIQLDALLAQQDYITQYDQQHWRAVWPNPVTGEEALYVASHAFGVDGLDPDAGQTLIDELIDWCTQPQYVYSHQWEVGDLLVWDERATMHRGRPWPYDEERTMASCCTSAQLCDGVDLVRSAAPPAKI